MLRILPAIEPLFPHTPDSQLDETESQLELVLHHAKSTMQRGHSETTRFGLDKDNPKKS